MTSMTIRMGAANWDARIHNPPAHFNFREMTMDQRKVWYRAFMDSVRAVYGKGGQNRRTRRSKARSRRR